VQHDAEIEGNHRIRFGAYFFSEPPDEELPPLSPRDRPAEPDRE
jgi:hypothetical protein